MALFVEAGVVCECAHLELCGGERVAHGDAFCGAKDLLGHDGGGARKVDQIDVMAQFSGKFAADPEELDRVQRGGRKDRQIDVAAGVLAVGAERAEQVEGLRRKQVERPKDRLPDGIREAHEWGMRRGLKRQDAKDAEGEARMNRPVYLTETPDRVAATDPKR